MNYNFVKFLTSYGRPDQIPESTKPEIVFAGRSNVGKSSLINKFFNQKSLARVSATPGKTATINFFECGELYFADLPGYGFAKVSKVEKQRWSTLIGGYLQSGRDIRLVLSLVDIRHKPSKDDETMINFLIDEELPFVVILTKADKLSKAQLARRIEELREEVPCGDQITMIPTSSETGLGIEDIRAIVAELEAEYIVEKAEKAESEELQNESDINTEEEQNDDF